MVNLQYDNRSPARALRFNYWDFIALLLLFSLLFLFAWTAKNMASPYQLGQPIPIHLDIAYLPEYALRSVLRMFIALFFSFIFTFTVGTLAAKNKKAEIIILPLIDILQSIPVLSYLSISISACIALFPGNLLGPECASILAIFTAQTWNMTLGFYQSIQAIPTDIQDAAKLFQMNAWQRFWRIELPFSASSLIWNTMMSMSASWFFVVASEAIFISNQTILLPGIGSYIATAISQGQIKSVIYALITMGMVIVIYDQLLFRPLLYWIDKFQLDPQETKMTRSWFLSLLQPRCPL